MFKYKPITMFCNKKAVIDLGKNNVFHAGTKHRDVLKDYS